MQCFLVPDKHLKLSSDIDYSTGLYSSTGHPTHPLREKLDHNTIHRSSWLCSAVFAARIQRAGVDAASCQCLLCMLVATLLHSRSALLCSVHMEGWCGYRYLLCMVVATLLYSCLCSAVSAAHTQRASKWSSLGCAHMWICLC